MKAIPVFQDSTGRSVKSILDAGAAGGRSSAGNGGGKDICISILQWR
jgi:hypothetical protein